MTYATNTEIVNAVSPLSDTSTVDTSSTSRNERTSTLLTHSIQDLLRFKKRRIHGEQKVRTLLPRHILQSDLEQQSIDTEEKLEQIRNYHKHYARNDIRTTKYTVLSFIPKNLFEQFHRFANCYFVFIILLNFIPQIGAIQPYLSMVPVIGILLLQAIKDLIEDYGRYQNDRAVNNADSEVHMSDDDKYHHIKWANLQVGDIVRVMCNDVIPADVLLLHASDVDGRCFIETSNIDGETNLKQRTVVQRHWDTDNPSEFHPRDFKSIIECQIPNNEIYKFHGHIIPPDNGDKIPINNNNLLLRGCVLRNTDYVEGVVIYAGHETKAMLNNNGPRHKRSKLERKMNTDVIYCVVLLIIMCLVGAIGNSIWANYQNSISQSELYLPPDENGAQLDPALSGFYMFWTMVILLQVLIPISLYVSIELVKWMQVYLINNDRDLYHEESDTPMRCRALNITEDLGQIQFVFSDKTGTLTENQMVFRRCTVGGVDYPHAANAARIENLEPTPADINPASSKHAEAFPPRETTSRQSYRRPHSSSIRPHHREVYSESDAGRGLLGRRKLSSTTTNKHHEIDVSTLDDIGGHDRLTKSAPNSPGVTRKNKPSTRRPAAHHRRNISTVSAKEVQATIAHQPDEPSEPDQPFIDEPIEDLETDVTPDPVLFELLQSIKNPCKSDGDSGVKMTVKKGRILDFFVNLAICNTVVISAHDHEREKNRDKMEASTSGQPTGLFDFVRSSGQPSGLLDFVPNALRNFSDKLASPTGDRYMAVSSIETTPGAFNTRKENTLHKAVHFVADSLDSSPQTYHNGDVSEMSFTDEQLSRIQYEAESPDEAALVYAAHAYGCILAHRSARGGKETVTMTLPGGEGTMNFEVLQKLPFDSARKRMSVIVRDPRTGQVTLYCKGADSAILSQLADPIEELDPDRNDLSNQTSNSREVVEMTKKFLDAYAKTGLRTLCITKKDLTTEEYAEWLSEYQAADRSLDNREQLVMDCFYKIETDLELLGATGIEDRLQDGVPETIEALRQAGIQVWVVTGDKQETAINIGYSCRLIHLRDEVIQLNAESKEALQELLNTHNAHQDEKRGRLPDLEKQNSTSILNSLNIPFVLSSTPSYPTIDDKDMPALVLVIDGKTLAFALQKDVQKNFVNLARRCRSVLCCRATPLQKGEVVKLIRNELKVMTLAIGDGANDVSMIQVADVGIGLSGKEGMQAVMSSDYALAQFRFLRKLLLVHGHWNYARLASMVLYFFYKNAAFVFLIFWFQIYCGFSGGNMIEQWYLIFFNLIFTSLPPLINGALDKDISAVTLLQKPHLYKQGINDELYLQRSFWINILDAVYQSLVIFFFSYLAYRDSTVGLLEWGTVVTSASVFVILVHLGVETKTWTWIHWASQVVSILLYFGFSLIYNIVAPATPAYYLMERLIQTPTFWFSILLIVAVALFPRYFIRTLQSKMFASESQRERILEKRPRVPFSSASMSSSATSGSSTYPNPTFQAKTSIRSNHSINNHRPASLFHCGDGASMPSSSKEFAVEFAGSTPDLSTKSPYYGNHNHSNNSHYRHSAAAFSLPLDGGGATSQAYTNNAFTGSLDCDQDSDTGECRKIDPVPRRPSMKLAYGQPDLGDSALTPRVPRYEDIHFFSSDVPPTQINTRPVDDVTTTTSSNADQSLASNGADYVGDIPV